MEVWQLRHVNSAAEPGVYEPSKPCWYVSMVESASKLVPTMLPFGVPTRVLQPLGGPLGKMHVGETPSAVQLEPLMT